MRINLFLNEKYFKDRFIREGANDYIKRCRRFVEIKLFYKIEKNFFIEPMNLNINITKQGKNIDSIEFSRIINTSLNNRFKNINMFFEGGQNQNFSHDICFFNVDILSTGFLYVMALEQVYRAYKIINKEPYHK